jgi:quercetin dioxygenase-like cupin family protein
VSIVTQSPPKIVYAGLDESGSLTADSLYFCVAIVMTPTPLSLRHLIRRAASRSGKRLGRPRKEAAEIKWSNASQRIRALALAGLVDAEVELFALTVLKGGRRVEDTPENYAILACELLSFCWSSYPNVALAVDRHFTSEAQIASVNTRIHRAWPPAGVLSVTHVDSQHNALVQLADLVAGSVYAWHKSGDETVQLISGKFGASLVEDWRHIKARWL